MLLQAFLTLIFVFNIDLFLPAFNFIHWLLWLFDCIIYWFLTRCLSCRANRYRAQISILVWCYELAWSTILVFVLMESQTLHVDQLFDNLRRVKQLCIAILPLPVKLDLWCRRLLQSKNLCEVLMLYGLVHIQSLSWIKAKQLRYQVYGQRWRVWELSLP